MNINLFYQPTGNSCGPTCLYMVLDYILNTANDYKLEIIDKYTIENICQICGTDWEVGTPPDRMEKGMKVLEFNYLEHIGSPQPYDFLKSVINAGHIPIVRTITNGVPHWIIVKGFDEENKKYLINCPSRGVIQYTEKELDNVWSLRNYQFFQVKPENKYSLIDFTNAN